MEYKIREKLFGANKASAIGTSLTLNDTVKYPINKLTIDGVCEQKTTTGKNLLDLSNLTSRVWNGITITRREDGSYSFSGTATNSTSFTLPLNLTLSPGAYTFSLETVQGFLVRLEDENNVEVFKVNDNKKSVTVTLSEEKQIKRLYFWASSGSTYNKDVFPQLEQGSQATYFESYTGKQPSPSPDFSQNISVLTGNIKLTSCGKNLVNPTTATFTRNGVTFTKNDDGTYTLNGTSTQSFDNNIISIQNKINVDKNNFYKLSLKVFSGTCSGGNLSSNVNLIINNNSTWNWLSTNNVAKQPTDNGYIGFVNLYVIKNIIFNDYRIGIQLEVVENSSSPSTDYEPYQGSSLNITIPSNEFVGKLDDTYKDTLNVVYKDDGHYHLMLNKMIGKKVVDGNTGIITKISDNHFGINDAIKNFLHFSDLTINNNKNNKYIILSQTSSNSQFISIAKDYNYAMNFTSTEKFNNIRIKDIRFNTVDELKQSLNEKPMEVYYTLNLNSRYSLDLGIVDTLLSYDEITNIFSDSDLYPVINVKYYNGSLDISNYEFSIKEV
jgi:hypothetical protein